MALVDCTTSATPTTQSPGSGVNSFGSITCGEVAKDRQAGVEVVGRGWVRSIGGIVSSHPIAMLDRRIKSGDDADQHAYAEFIGKLKIYPRSKNRNYYCRSLAHRGRRRSRRLMTERGAAPDNGIAVEPREAQRPTSLAARTPQRRSPVTGISPWVAVDRKVRQAASSRSVGEPRKLPGASRRSIPSIEGKRKTGCGPPRARKTRAGAAERWLNPTRRAITAAFRLRAAPGSPPLPDRDRAPAAAAIRR